MTVGLNRFRRHSHSLNHWLVEWFPCDRRSEFEKSWREVASRNLLNNVFHERSFSVIIASDSNFHLSESVAHKQSLTEPYQELFIAASL